MSLHHDLPRHGDHLGVALTPPGYPHDAVKTLRVDDAATTGNNGSVGGDPLAEGAPVVKVAR